MTGPDRAALAAAQAALLDALLDGGPAPAGTDPVRLQVQARALAAKRREHAHAQQRRRRWWRR